MSGPALKVLPPSSRYSSPSPCLALCAVSTRSKTAAATKNDNHLFPRKYLAESPNSNPSTRPSWTSWTLPPKNVVGQQHEGFSALRVMSGSRPYPYLHQASVERSPNQGNVVRWQLRGHLPSLNLPSLPSPACSHDLGQEMSLGCS